ncbi:MAG: cytochrome c3 family protein [Spirochaetia bacterium]|nr:cytochrome c3 family protein [Spirochaetia bacterium]
MLNKKSTKIILFLIIPVIIAGISFFYNFAGYLFSPGPLTLGHKTFDNSCFKCHMPLISASTSCLGCHESTQKSIKNKTGFHGNMLEEDVKKCIRCHTDHAGAQKLIIKDARKVNQFSHDLEKIREKNFLAASPELNQVKEEYTKLWEKVSSESDWENRFKVLKTDFDHKLTGYPLIGEHAKVKCEDCHKNTKDFRVDAKEGLIPSFSLEKVMNKDFCYSCHKKDDDGKKGHKGEYGKNCASCHTIGGGVEKGWKALVPKIRKHHQDKKHELIGHHKKTSCIKCHKSIPFTKKIEETTCYYCHEKLDKKFHEQSLGKRCEDCHTPESFRKSTFDHQKTKFPLKFTHKKVKCQKCHFQWDEAKLKPKIYKSLANSVCFDCHARDDVHHGTFKNDCAQCHKESYWGDINQR